MNITISWRIWQNMWKKTKNQHALVEHNGAIICTGYHSKTECRINETGELARNPANNQGNTYMDNIDIDDYIIIPESKNSDEFLLVKVTGKAVLRTLNDVIIYKNTKGKVIEISLRERPCTKKWASAEVMTAYVRDVQVIKKLHVSEYPEIINKYKGFKTRGSIVRNKSKDIITI